jgi:hypothetical protein
MVTSVRFLIRQKPQGGGLGNGFEQRAPTQAAPKRPKPAQGGVAAGRRERQQGVYHKST